MWRQWLWRTRRTPEVATYDGTALAGGQIHVGCVRSHRHVAAAIRAFGCGGAILWLEATGTAQLEAPHAHRLRAEEPDIPAILATASRHRGFDLIILTLTGSPARPEAGELAAQLAAAAQAGRMHLAVILVGTIGWRDPLARALANRGNRLPTRGTPRPDRPARAEPTPTATATPSTTRDLPVTHSNGKT